jgi:hypothetical protein
MVCGRTFLCAMPGRATAQRSTARIDAVCEACLCATCLCCPELRHVLAQGTRQTHATRHRKMKRAIVHLELRSSTVGRSCETLLGEKSRNKARRRVPRCASFCLRQCRVRLGQPARPVTGDVHPHGPRPARLDRRGHHTPGPARAPHGAAKRPLQEPASRARASPRRGLRRQGMAPPQG